jgi:DNA-binding NtrC family response regulator
VSVPPLRERREDVPLLVDHFIARFNAIRNKDVSGVSDDVMARFLRHDWPGNVRELGSALEHAFILCRGGVIDVQHLPEQFRSTDEPTPAPARTLAEIEAVAIRDALRRNDWNRLATARELGIDKTTLWRKLKRLGITPEQDAL